MKSPRDQIKSTIKKIHEYAERAKKTGTYHDAVDTLNHMASVYHKDLIHALEQGNKAKRNHRRL